MSVDETMEHPARKQDATFRFLVISISVFLLGAVGVIAWQAERESSDLAWMYAALILILPLLQIPFVIYMLKEGSLVLIPALLVEVVLWLAFELRNQPFLQGNAALGALSSLGLLAALVLGGLIFGVTGLMMGLGDGRGKNYRRLFREQPFLIVCFFLTVFTLITVFLSLSLALHDQDLRLNHNGYALYSDDLRMYEKPEAIQKQNPEEEGDRKAPEQVGPTDPYFRLLFAEGSASVDFLPGPTPVSEGDSRKSAQKSPGNAFNDREAREAHNRDALDALVKAIVEQAQKDHVRVVLAGHSDEGRLNPDTSPYRTNFELSHARVNQAMVVILSDLKKRKDLEWRRKIEWILLPCGAEKAFLGDVEDDGPEHQRSVEVALLPADGDRFSHAYQLGGKDLGLLDYIYFMVYTITTTGYGDIIPISSFSKFLTTVANFFEVFLIVVFFNVLLSFLRENGGSLKSGGTVTQI